MIKKQIRCAIYTRKSNEEGLEQNFNSLDAQRESCEAYIKSQIHEGWTILPKHYDDGGFSGGTMNRPAFQELLKDIEADKIDIVVVYKVDRLTRSLMDFSKIVDIFDKHHTSFVSITQHFNTTTSMGRLTLNILLSFAQFEREVTGERIRDKFAASAKKGLWITGLAPLGYIKSEDVLIEDKTQSYKIKTIFEKYLNFGSVAKLKIYLDKNKIYTRKNKPFSKGNLYHILSNKVYVGKIVKGKYEYEGKHKSIIDTELFTAVQKRLNENCIYDVSKEKISSNAMLQGKLFDEKGNYFSPSKSTGRAGKIYNYYINQGFKQGKYKKNEVLVRIPSNKIETFVTSKVAEFLKNTKIIQKIINDYPLNIQAEILKKLSRITINKDIIRRILNKVIIHNDTVEIYFSKRSVFKLCANEDKFFENDNITVKYNAKITQCSLKGGTIIIGKENNYNQVLVDAVVKGFYYNKLILEGNINADVKSRNARRLRNLRFLPPEIIEQILTGTQDKNLTVEKLCKMCA